MFFLRIDYVPSCGGVQRVRGIYPTYEDVLAQLRQFEKSNVLLVRCELCSPSF